MATLSIRDGHSTVPHPRASVMRLLMFLMSPVLLATVARYLYGPESVNVSVRCVTMKFPLTEPHNERTRTFLSAKMGGRGRGRRL